MAGMFRHVARLLYVCALILGVAGRASAQYRIDAWTTENGLPQNAVTEIAQTRDGFLWLATFGGLVRFDGANMHVFTTVNAPGMRSSRLTGGLIETSDGALWINTEAHGVVRYVSRTFATYSVADGLPDTRVRVLFLEDGRLVVDTPNGMVRWDGTRFVPHTSVRPAGNDAQRVVISQSTSPLWYRDAVGIHRLENGRVTRTLPGLNPRRLFEDHTGRIWMETQDRHLQSVTPAGVMRTYGPEDGVIKFITSSMSEDREGNMWFGLRANGGLLCFDGARFTHYSTADGLPSDSVGRVFQDREGTRWVPTDGGLARMTRRSMTTYSSADGLEADNTYPILQDSRGDVLIGGWAGLTRYHDGRFTPVSKEFGLFNVNVMSLAEDRDGALWIGTWGGPVRRVKDGKVTTFAETDAPGGVTRVILAGRSDLWVGGSTLWRFRDSAFAGVAGYSGGEIHALLEDRTGALWIGTESGIVRYRDDTFTAYGAKEGITGPVRAIHEDRDGTLWLGTYDSGLFRWRDGRFTRYTTREGLFANGAFQIVEDSHDRFWIGSNSGIYRVSRRELDAFANGAVREITSVPYGLRDGMLNPECNGGAQPSGIRTRDGRIWFPTQRGVTVFDPETIPVDTTPPPVLITGLLVADRQVPLGDRIEIRSDPRSVEVQYAALTFIRPELTRFRYRIEGLDSQWVNAGQARAAHFAQLPYGTFTFRVIAANRDGVWNERGAAVRIVVVPPFWRTAWFGAILFGGVAALSLGVHRARIAHVRRQEALRAAFSRQLIDTQEGDRRRIAAGLHDGLSQSLIVIKNWAALGKKGLPPDHAATERLAEIESTAAQALGELRDVVHDLAPHNLERLGLAQSIQEMVDKIQGAAGIHFKCRVASLDGAMPKPVQINLYRIVQEAVNNVVKHSGAARAWVEMDADGGVLRVAVRDDGRGFDKGMRPDPGSGGFGLFGMAERLRMIGGRLAIDSAPGRGTSIMIELPLENAS
jgi:signal transduction histidine kinase/ligand-binding sensor domain-containing protein